MLEDSKKSFCSVLVSAVVTHNNFLKLDLPVLPCLDLWLLLNGTSEKVHNKRHLLVCSGEKFRGGERSFVSSFA